MRNGITRRSVGLGIAVVLCAGAISHGVCGASDASDPVHLSLPTPLGEATLRSYGEELEDWAFDLVLLEDGGTLLVGQANNRGLAHTVSPGDSRVLRLDSDGNVVWERDYNVDVHGLLYSPISVGSGEFVILGQIQASRGASSDDLHLIKIDGAGEVIWSRSLGSRGNDIGKMVRQTSDGGYILTGSWGVPHGRIFLMKTDGEGNETWMQTYGDRVVYISWGVEQTPDGGYVLAGWEAKTLDDRDVFIIKTDAQGDVEWSRNWDLMPGEADGAFDLILTSDEHILVCGIQSMYTAPRKAVLLKVDLDGEEVWMRRFSSEEAHLEFWDVMEDTDGGYIACGARLTGNMAIRNGITREGLILKVDADGDLLWEQTIATPEYEMLMLSSAAVTPNGGYVFVGGATPVGAEAADMLWMKVLPPSD